MNNHRDLLGIVLNVLFALVVLGIIIIGLNRMGLYELPSVIENMFTGSSEQENSVDVDDGKVYSSVGYDDEKSAEVEKTLVTYENARLMLEKVKSVDDYHHEVYVSRDDKKTNDDARINIDKKDGLYRASVYTGNGKLTKEISEKDGNITVKEYVNEKLKSEFTYPSGNFTVGELAGVILDHENFLSGEYALSEGEFSVIQGDFGIELEIAFDTVMDNYKQREVYRMNLDYGVVVSARCYENDVLIYDMQTVNLKENG